MRTLIFITLIAVAEICASQVCENSDVYIIKTQYKNKTFPEAGSVSYCLIQTEVLSTKLFQDVDTTYSVKYPSYYITKAGGFYISESSFEDLYTFCCCRFHNIRDSITKSNVKIYNTYYDSIQQQKQMHTLSVVFKNNGVKFKFKDNSKSFIITVWRAKLDFCVCNMYMESAKQPIYNNKFAYIRTIRSKSKPNKMIKNKLKHVFSVLSLP